LNLILIAILAAIGIAFWISFFATAMSRRVSHQLGMLDMPARHKGHGGPMPLLGGTAIFCAILVPTLLGLAVCCIWAIGDAPKWLPRLLADHIPGAASRSGQALGILAAAAVLHIVGLIDDKRHLGPWIKLLAQMAVAATVVIFCNVRILTLAGPAISITVSILWLVVIMNAFNFLDNMDGLAAGVAAVCAAALLSAALSMQQWFVVGWLCLIFGALLGFLPYNFPPARIFMGDAGSLVVGFLLGVVSCLTTYVKPGQANIVYGLFVPLLVMAVPLYDMASVLLIRIRERRHPMVGDQRHFSHRLLRRGMSKRTTVLTIFLCTAGTAIAAPVLPHTRGVMPAILLVGQVVVILMIIALLESTEKTGGA